MRGAAFGLDYGLTQSCYNPGPAGPCGRCDSCVLRANGFSEAGLEGFRVCPMTDRIYYTEPSCRSFEATVTRLDERDGRPARGTQPHGFYPTSGGQPFDRPAGSAPWSRPSTRTTASSMWSSAPPAPGTNVRGEIDLPRRFIHMHNRPVSTCCGRLRPPLRESDDQLPHGRGGVHHRLGARSHIGRARRAVDEANHVVWENREVSVLFVSAHAAARPPLRKEPSARARSASWKIRISTSSACAVELTSSPRSGSHHRHTWSVSAAD